MCAFGGGPGQLGGRSEANTGETLRKKYDFERREGFDAEALRIPERVLETPSPLRQLDEVFLRQVIVHFVEYV